MWDEFSTTMFGGTPYEMEIIGTEENINAFTREMISDYYNRYYHPENMTLVVVGDIQFDQVKNLAEKYYSVQRPVKAGKIYNTPTVLELKDNVEKVITKDIAQEYGVLSFPAEGLMDSDNYALEVLAEILSGGEFSVLNKRFKYEKQLVNSISGGYYGLRQRGTFVFSYNAPLGRSEKIKEEILASISDIEGMLTDQAIEKAKNRLKSQSAFQRERSGSEANDIGFSYTVGLPEYYHDFLERIGEVSKSDIVKAVQSIFERKYVWIRTMPDQDAETKKAG
jgi:predicted Zn-dependent peptidase